MKRMVYSIMLVATVILPAMAGDGGQGGIFGPAAVVKKGKLMIGAEGQYHFDGQDKLGVLGHVRYGLMPSFEINADLGMLRGEMYFGGGVDYQAVHDTKGGLGVLVRAGAFSSDGGAGSGFHVAGLVGNQFRLVNIYGGLESRFITDPDVTVLNAIGGIQIPFQSKMAFIGEVGINVNDKPASYFSGGVLFGL